ncbi:hypothetical protein LIA77_02138 [Sarocladium implicatum]|nr:hypothetical protein LIA77_02138 [Sarocladium implicatum]
MADSALLVAVHYRLLVVYASHSVTPQLETFKWTVPDSCPETQRIFEHRQKKKHPYHINNPSRPLGQARLGDNESPYSTLGLPLFTGCLGGPPQKCSLLTPAVGTLWNIPQNAWHQQRDDIDWISLSTTDVRVSPSPTDNDLVGSRERHGVSTPSESSGENNTTSGIRASQDSGES